jgi:hypothetical protein
MGHVQACYTSGTMKLKVTGIHQTKQPSFQLVEYIFSAYIFVFNDVSTDLPFQLLWIYFATSMKIKLYTLLCLWQVWIPPYLSLETQST